MNPGHSVTLKDIAQRGRVHFSTVSLALRNSRQLPEATRRRIRQIAEEMGYQPNPLVSALMAQRGRRAATTVKSAIAYLLPYPREFQWKQNPLHHSIFQGACKRAGEFGFHVEPIDLTDTGISAARVESILSARGITGLLVPPFVQPPTQLQQLSWHGFAAVTLGSFYAPAIVDYVCNDHHQSMRLIHAKCRELGYRRIGFVLTARTDAITDYRFSSAHKFEQDRLPARDRVAPLHDEIPSGEFWPRRIADWCRREKPDVIVTPVSQNETPWLDLIARLPGRPALVSISVEQPDGRLAGISQDGFEIGGLGAQTVINKIYRNDVGEHTKRRALLLSGVWVDGRSCPPKAVSTDAVTRRRSR